MHTLYNRDALLLSLTTRSGIQALAVAFSGGCDLALGVQNASPEQTAVSILQQSYRAPPSFLCTAARYYPQVGPLHVHTETALNLQSESAMTQLRPYGNAGCSITLISMAQNRNNDRQRRIALHRMCPRLRRSCLDFLYMYHELHGTSLHAIMQAKGSRDDVLGLGSVSSEQTDSRTLLIVRAGLH